jgi:hypothetical protein
MHFLRQRKRMIGTFQPTSWRLWGMPPLVRLHKARLCIPGSRQLFPVIDHPQHLNRASDPAPGTRGEKTCARACAPLRSRLRRTKHTYLPFLTSGDREALDDLCALVSTAALGLGLCQDLGGLIHLLRMLAAVVLVMRLRLGELQVARHARGRAERQRARG